MVMRIWGDFADRIGMRPIAIVPAFGDQLPGGSGKPKLIDVVEGEPLPHDFPRRCHLQDTIISERLRGDGRGLDPHCTQYERVPISPSDGVMMEFDTPRGLADPQTHRCLELPYDVGVPIQLAQALVLYREDMAG